VGQSLSWNANGSCTTHKIQKKKTSMPRRDSNTQFQQASSRTPTP